jgi:hypothetical protein
MIADAAVAVDLVGSQSKGTATQSRTLLVAAAYNDGCITVWEVAAGSAIVSVKHRFWPECEIISISDISASTAPVPDFQHALTDILLAAAGCLFGTSTTPSCYLCSVRARSNPFCAYPDPCIRETFVGW